MKAFASIAAALLAVAAPAAAAFAQAPAAGLQPSEPAAIAAAASSCRNALTAGRLDEARLTTEGWAAASLGPNMQAAASQLHLFTRNAIMLVSTPSNPGCILVARVDDAARYAAVIQALTIVFGAPSQTGARGPTLWVLAGGTAVQAEAAGTPDRPGVRIAIVPGAAQ